jgi:hypothetical protein
MDWTRDSKKMEGVFLTKCFPHDTRLFVCLPDASKPILDALRKSDWVDTNKGAWGMSFKMDKRNPHELPKVLVPVLIKTYEQYPLRFEVMKHNYKGNIYDVWVTTEAEKHMNEYKSQLDSAISLAVSGVALHSQYMPFCDVCGLPPKVAFR